MKMMNWTLALVMGLALQATAMADEHPAAAIKGTGIDLFEKDHAFSGQILETPVFGEFDHEPFGGRILLRRGDRTITLELKQVEGRYEGSVSETRMDSATGDSTTVTTSVAFVRIQMTGANEGLIYLSVDGTEVPVKVVGKSFDQGHFIEPRFASTINGESVAFDFSGVSCFGYSTNIAMMIYGAYAHILK